MIQKRVFTHICAQMHPDVTACYQQTTIVLPIPIPCHARGASAGQNLVWTHEQARSGLRDRTTDSGTDCTGETTCFVRGSSGNKLQASLSGLFLLTLPDLVTPGKQHHAVLAVLSCICPPKQRPVFRWQSFLAHLVQLLASVTVFLGSLCCVSNLCELIARNQLVLTHSSSLQTKRCCFW